MFRNNIPRRSNARRGGSGRLAGPAAAWNHSRSDRLAALDRENLTMSDDTPAPPLVYEGLDPVPQPKPAIEKVSEAVQETAQRIGDAIEIGRRPGMPLSVLSNIVREAPLGSLFVAFVLGVAFARRR
jgi:hypothetical protein